MVTVVESGIILVRSIVDRGDHGGVRDHFDKVHSGLSIVMSLGSFRSGPSNIG